MSCSFSSSSSSSSCSSSKLVSRKRKKSTDDGATEEIANSKDNRLTCRECGKKIPPSKSKSHICKSCDREKSCQYQREKRRLAQLAVQRLPLHLPNEQEYQQDNTKRAKLAASVETQREIDMEADKENRDTQNLLVFPQTPSKKERTAAEQQLQFATPMKTRQMNTCLSSPMFTVAVKQIQAQAMNQCRIQQQHFIQCINFAERREQQMQSEMNANKMEIERKEALFEREKNHLQLKVEHLHNKIEIAKKRKREVESKYIVVKKARKAVVGKRQMQYNCQKLMQILVKSILHGRGVYFERYCGHSLSGNGVKNLLNCYPGILADLVPHTTPLFRHLYAQYFSNLLEMYRLCMRVDTLNVLDFSRYNLLCYRYMDYRKDCLRNVHNNEWHRELTPKEHTMLCHFERFMTDHQSLGRFSEQSHEAIHHAFNSIADRYCGKHELIDQLPFILRRANEQHLYLSDPNA